MCIRVHDSLTRILCLYLPLAKLCKSYNVGMTAQWHECKIVLVVAYVCTSGAKAFDHEYQVPSKGVVGGTVPQCGWYSVIIICCLCVVTIDDNDLTTIVCLSSIAS